MKFCSECLEGRHSTCLYRGQTSCETMDPFPSQKTAAGMVGWCRTVHFIWITGSAFLVGGWATPLKNMKVNWDDYSQYFWENKKCSKPPTRFESVHFSGKPWTINPCFPLPESRFLVAQMGLKLKEMYASKLWLPLRHDFNGDICRSFICSRIIRILDRRPPLPAILGV